MARKVLDATVTSTDFYDVFDNVVASNPQLNQTITEVKNESNIFLVEILQYYPYQDLALVKINDTNEKVLTYLTHEILSDTVSINAMGDGVVKTDNTYGTYISPYDTIYGVMAKVRWSGTEDKNCLLSCVNLSQSTDVTERIGTGEIKFKVGESSISLTKDWINIKTPKLFINGLPSTAPELENYYDKTETSIIVNSLQEEINAKEEENNILKEYSFSDLQEFIDNADDGSTLNLNGIFKYNSETDSDYVNGVIINKDLTINTSSSLTIDGNNLATCLLVSNNKKLVLSNVTIINGVRGIYCRNYSSLDISNCIIANNKLIESNGVGIASLRVANGTIDNCTFKGNECIRDSDEDWSIHKTGMGTVYVGYGSTCKITNSKFNDNYSYLTTVLVVSYDETNGLSQSTTYIENNKSDKKAIIYIDEFGMADILNCNFLNNTVTSGNGMVFGESAKKFNVKNCYFNGNKGDKGSAIASNHYDTNAINLMNIYDCTFINNTSSTQGTVYLFDVTNGVMSNCTFNNNKCENGYGALYVNKTTAFERDCNFTLLNTNFVTKKDNYYIGNKVKSTVHNCFNK